MGTAIPETPTARANHGLLIRTSKEAGQRSIQPDNWMPPTYEEHQAVLLLVQRYCHYMQESVK